MNARLFSFAMSEIDDRYVEEALTYQASARTRRRHTWLRYLAVACLVAILSFGTALAVSPEVREAVFGWFKEQHESFTHYEYHAPEESTPASGGGEQQTYPRYILSQLPEGYREVDSSYDEILPAQATIYQGEDSSMLFFLVTIGTEDGGNLFVQEEGNTIQQVEVAGVTGDLYIPDDPADYPCLVWAKDGVLFSLGGGLTREELIALAERVEKIP